ncbi:MAG: hypothetical protein AB7L84_11410 [Acidimicrobiia bacterium]
MHPGPSEPLLDLPAGLVTLPDIPEGDHRWLAVSRHEPGATRAVDLSAVPRAHLRWPDVDLSRPRSAPRFGEVPRRDRPARRWRWFHRAAVPSAPCASPSPSSS